ncbi:hypothetical protein Esti_004160 [Eimeria stiedai]
MDPSAVGELRFPLGVPPPPPAPVGPGAPGGLLEAGNLLPFKTDGATVSRKAPERVVVGEIRQNLDDLKAAVLSYYSRLYSNIGRSIDERLDRLAGFPSSNLVSPLAMNMRRHGQRRPRPEPPPPNACFAFLAKEQADSKDAKDSKPTPALETHRTFYEMAQLPGQKADPSVKGHDNLLGHGLEETRGGQINEMLGELRKKCKAATKRLNTIGDQLERECEDPNLREWEFTTYPEVRRRPHLGSDPQLRRHLLTLYQDLAHQSQTNQLKINAIQGKLKVLNLHTKSDMIKLKSDPRIAF